MDHAPTILITSSCTTYLGIPAFRLSENYADAIIEAGGIPITAPATERLDVYARLLDRADGLLLSGGADIDPARFTDWEAGACAEGGDASAAQLVNDPTPIRDAAELALIAEAERRGMPIFGICRGLQILNVAHGGTLVLDLEAERTPSADTTPNANAAQTAPIAAPHIVHNEYMDGTMTHEVQVVRHSLLAELVEAPRLTVNSMHHQAIRTLGRGMRVAATAPDGVIEAVEVASSPFELAVQWHPEYLTHLEPMYRLFASFVEAARTFRAAGARAGLAPR